MSRFVQATSRCRLRDLGPGPARIGVSSAQTTCDKMISARIALFASATAAAARLIMPCTNPGDGFAPVRSSISRAQRCTGM